MAGVKRPVFVDLEMVEFVVEAIVEDVVEVVVELVVEVVVEVVVKDEEPVLEVVDVLILTILDDVAAVVDFSGNIVTVFIGLKSFKC